jgi:thiol-disulfide isomerase/thioredoxin
MANNSYKKPKPKKGTGPGRPTTAAVPKTNPTSPDGSVKSKRGPSKTVIYGAALAAVAIIAAIVAVVATGSNSPTATAGAVVMPLSYDNTIENVTPRSMFISSQEASGLTPPAELPPKLSKVLMSDGKIDIYYFGAEYCGGCAGLSWPLVEALAKFGRFHNLAAVISSPKDAMPNVAGASFVGTTYTSNYINFMPVELYSNTQIAPGKWQPLQTMTPEEQKLRSTWDQPPYAYYKGSLPFLLIASRYYHSTPGYYPSWLDKSGIKHTVVQAAGGAFPTTMDLQAQAGHIIGAICASLHNSAPVCKGIPKSLEKFIIPVAYSKETPPS